MEIVVTSEFKRNFKHLSRKYRSLTEDIRQLQQQLMENPLLGVGIADGFRKIRLPIKSKGKGKSGGARVITFNYYVEDICQRIVMVKMYDKSEVENVSEAEIRHAFETLNSI